MPHFLVIKKVYLIHHLFFITIINTPGTPNSKYSKLLYINQGKRYEHD